MATKQSTFFHDLKYLLSCDSFSELADASGKILDSNIVILNNTFRVLSTFCSDSNKDNLVIPTINSYLGTDADYFSELCDAFDKSKNLNNATVISNLPENYYSICKTVFINNFIFCYIWITVPFEKYNDEYIYLIETCAITAIRLSENRTVSMTSSSTLFSELLAGKVIPESITLHWLEQIHWKLESYAYVVVIRNPIGKLISPEVINNFDIRDSDQVLQFDGDIVWIMNQSKPLQGFDIERIEPLNKKLIELNLYAGLSRQCPRIDHIYKSYKQAICSVEKCINNQNENIHILPYIDTWIDDLLNEICDTVDLKKYCTPQLALLEKYDLENNSDLLKTLTCYFDHNQSVKDTAAQMFIHRNTVKYRLNKCEEILETDLSNMSRNIGIYFSLKVITFLQTKTNK